MTMSEKVPNNFGLPVKVKQSVEFWRWSLGGVGGGGGRKQKTEDRDTDTEYGIRITDYYGHEIAE